MESPRTKKWQHFLLKDKRRWGSPIVSREKQTSTEWELTHRCHWSYPRSDNDAFTMERE